MKGGRESFSKEEQIKLGPIHAIDFIPLGIQCLSIV